MCCVAHSLTLCHFDLQVVCVGEVGGGDPEAGGGHLFDGAAGAAVGVCGVEEALLYLAALARVGLGAHSVHGHGQRLVRLLRDAAQTHRSCTTHK